ncbi:SPFH domain-containing protein [Eilatimonas milleporae]|uniref:Protein QmcA n=1 Tax=Eilatimonas milleporae TaxID=911205 RepID=A0A3M0CME1_9PROT|nr:SPFH domain-containing protein [Eilatimonas milleporae]RMB04403.1 SPFH domain-containing protein [Eilatimonas milleporae]
MVETLILFGVLILVAVILVFSAVVLVRQGNEYTLERLGRFVKTLRPGFHVIIPFIERIGARINLMEQVLDIPTQEVITRDNAMVAADGVVFFQVMDAAKAAYEVRNLNLAILNLTMTNLRTVMGSMDLDELLSKRDDINARLMSVVDEATQPWGVKITRIEIKDIAPPRDIVNAMARQMKAEREKRAAILEAEGQRESEILRAEGEKRAAILEAEGRREAAFKDAEAREREAEAEAKATEMVSTAIAAGDGQAIQYFVAQKYVDALKDFAASPNEKLVFMPLEASSVIGAIGGISDLLGDIGGRAGGGSGDGRGTGRGKTPAPLDNDRAHRPSPDSSASPAPFGSSGSSRASASFGTPRMTTGYGAMPYGLADTGGTRRTSDSGIPTVE